MDHVDRIAQHLIPIGGVPSRIGRNGAPGDPIGRQPSDGYFDEAGRNALRAFIHLEIVEARRYGRDASLNHMTDWIRDEVTPKAGGTADHADWINALSEALPKDAGSRHAAAGLWPFIDWQRNVLSGVLGTVDHALLPFRSAEIRRMAA